VTIENLDPKTPQLGDVSTFDDYMREIKEEVQDSLPSNSNASVLGLVRGIWTGTANDYDVVVDLGALPVNTPMLLQLDREADPSTTTVNLISDSGTYSIDAGQPMLAYVVYPSVRAGATVILLIQDVENGLTEVLGNFTVSQGPDHKYALNDANNCGTRLLGSGFTFFYADENANYGVTDPAGPCMVTVISDEASGGDVILEFKNTDTNFAVLNPSFSNTTVTRLQAATGKKFMFDLFFDGTRYYGTDYEEFNHR